MAETKPTKPSTDKKVIDVKRAGDAASGTSRQIILNNRPIMKDPMMAEVSALVDAETGASKAEDTPVPGAPVVSRKAKIIPISHDDATADETTEKSADAKPVAETAAPASKKTPKPKSDDTTPDHVGQETKKDSKPAKAAASIKGGEATDKDDSEEAAPTSKPDDAPLTLDDSKADTPEESADSAKQTVTDDSPDKTANKNDAGKQSEATPPTTEPANPEAQQGGGFAGTSKSNSGLQPGRSFDETEAPAAPIDDSSTQIDETKDKPKKPELQPGELTPEQQKAYDKGEYFLPIITTETRRMRLEVVLAVIFIVIILAVWLDVMLDAGLLHISGVQPLTHFFNS